jgi:hypothetical protein
MIVIAGNNKYDATKVSSTTFKDGRTLWYVTGKRWIKSKGHFSSNALIHCVGESQPLEVIEE